MRRSRRHRDELFDSLDAPCGVPQWYFRGYQPVLEDRSFPSPETV